MKENSSEMKFLIIEEEENFSRNELFGGIDGTDENFDNYFSTIFNTEKTLVKEQESILKTDITFEVIKDTEEISEITVLKNEEIFKKNTGKYTEEMKYEKPKETNLILIIECEHTESTKEKPEKKIGFMQSIENLKKKYSKPKFNINIIKNSNQNDPRKNIFKTTKNPKNKKNSEGENNFSNNFSPNQKINLNKDQGGNNGNPQNEKGDRKGSSDKQTQDENPKYDKILSPNKQNNKEKKILEAPKFKVIQKKKQVNSYFNVYHFNKPMNIIKAKKKKRKYKPDDIRKKIKSRFHKAIKNIINKNLIRAGSKYLFDFFPQYFISNITRSKNNEVLNLTYKELIEKNFLEDTNEKEYPKYNVDYNKYLKNLETLNYILKHPEINKNSGFYLISTMKYCDLLNEYFDSSEFKKSINKLYLENEKEDYIREYIIKARNYVKFFSSAKQEKPVQQDIITNSSTILTKNNNFSI